MKIDCRLSVFVKDERYNNTAGANGFRKIGLYQADKFDENDLEYELYIVALNKDNDEVSKLSSNRFKKSEVLTESITIYFFTASYIYFLKSDAIYSTITQQKI